MKKLTGPFSQILPLTDLPLKGALNDDRLQVIRDASILIDNERIAAVGNFNKLKKAHPTAEIQEVTGQRVVLPGFVDCHTHLCFAGNRANDYALRSQGKTYLEIAQEGGGIWSTVEETRAANEATLTELLLKRINRHMAEGVTTIEIKSGYGLSIKEELKQLRAIRSVSSLTGAKIVPTCLAAHVKPRDYEGSTDNYLNDIINELLPVIKQESLASRVDIFIEKGAFSKKMAFRYLTKANELGFDLTVHADQFTTGGSEVAVNVGAVSADHLEASKEREIDYLAKSGTVAVALPGASLGLGMKYAPGRKLLDAGASLAIASDWNPGSAPMGDLLMQAAVFGAAEKLSAAEIFAGLTFRAAHALRVDNRGTIAAGQHAALQMYPCDDYREILYNQGKLKPHILK